MQAQTSDYYYCLYLNVQGNSVFTSLGDSHYGSSEGIAGQPYSLSSYKEYCHDNYGFSNYSNGSRGTIIASSAFIVDADAFDEPQLGYIQHWNFSEVSSELGCHASSSDNSEGFNFASLGAAIAPLLPQSPEQFRLPTIISNMAGQGTLAANLAIELFSAVWQYAALLLGFKFIKFLRG